MNKSLLLVTLKRNALISKLSAMFLDDAEKFKGLYNGIERIVLGKGKKNFKPLFELYQRIQYMPKYSDIAEIIEPVFKSKEHDPRILSALGKIVFSAVDRAGINHDPARAVIILDQKSVMCYCAWEGDQVYPGDTVRIISPAWFQNDRLLEEGFCSKDLKSGANKTSKKTNSKSSDKSKKKTIGTKGLKGVAGKLRWRKK